MSEAIFYRVCFCIAGIISSLFIHSFIHSFTNSFFNLLIHSFTNSCNHSFRHSVIHVFIQSSFYDVVRNYANLHQQSTNFYKSREITFVTGKELLCLIIDYAMPCIFSKVYVSPFKLQQSLLS